MFEVDARPILPLIHAPTLVLHRRNVEFAPIQHGRYLAEHIPGASLIELPGVEGPLVWEMPQLTLDHVQEFLTGVGRVAEPTRVLSTVLFTDIVGSTERAAALGDRRWRELLNVHDELAQRLVEEFGGRLVKTTGDGILATFDGGPAAGSAARPPSASSWAASACRYGPGCTPAGSNWATTTSAASPCTSQPG
jgi:hypothetical protein